jgi:uncharacterized protein (TIGR03435 family)
MTGVRGDPGKYRAGNVTLHDLIGFAYRVEEIQISGGPGWIATDRYDVEAKTNRPASADEQSLMLRTLLAERFHLEVHKESKELRAYVLTAGKTGAHLAPAKIGPDGIPERAAATMEGLAGMISRMLNPPKRTTENAERLPVIDRTGIQGNFDIDPFLQAVMGGGAGGRGARETSDLIAEIQAAVDGLGLRLDVRKTLVDIIVIDRAEHPEPN